PDGASLITGGHDGVIQIWDVATGQEQRKLEPPTRPTKRNEDPEGITALNISPDGKKVAVSNRSQKIYLWDLAAGKISKVIPVESVWLRDLKFSPDGNTVAWCGTSSAHNKPSEGIRFWELATERQRLQLPGHQAGRTYGID